LGLPLGFTFFLMLTGCSVSNFAVDKIGNALAEGGSAYSADDDPEFVAQAVPFSLKLMESLLDQRPEHRGLLQAAAAGFTQYAYAFLQLPADEDESVDLERAEALRARARRMYMRAREYGLRGLEVARPGFRSRLLESPVAATASATRQDAGLLYWTAAAWAAAIGLSKDDPNLIGDLPKVQALIDRAFELDPDFDDGAIHTFLISFTMVRPDMTGPRVEVSRDHFVKALDLARRQAAGPYVAWAEGVCEPSGDRACFEDALHKALQVNPDAVPERRLVNLVMQRRAAWLLTQLDRRFIGELPADETQAGGQR